MTRIAALISFILIAVATAIAAGRSVADIPNVHVSDRSRYVSNPDGVLSERAERQLNNMLAGLWERTSAEVVVVAVADIDRPDDIDGFATDLFEEWGIGKSDRDNGLLILVARDSRKAVIRTGQGMEGVLPDIVAGRILRNKMFPLFREGNYDGGVMAATQEVGRVVSDPQYAEELRSKYANDSRANRGSDFDGEEFFNWYLKLSAIVGRFPAGDLCRLPQPPRRHPDPLAPALQSASAAPVSHSSVSGNAPPGIARGHMAHESHALATAQMPQLRHPHEPPR